MTKKLDKSGLKQSKFDPCPFVGEKVTCIVYVGDIIFWDRNKDAIDKFAMNLKELGVDLEKEDNAAGFLGVPLDREINTGLLEMRQTGFIQRVIEELGLADGIVKGKFTPS